MAQVGHLNELHEKYFDKGLRILAISAESSSTLESTMLEQNGAKYWIGSDPSRSMLKVYGGGGIPHAYLVDARGRIVANAGTFSARQIEPLLEQAFDPGLGRELHRSLRSAVRYYEKGDYGKAWKKAGRLVDNSDRAVASDAKYLRERCEDAAKWHRDMVEADIEDRNYAQAVADLEKIEDAFDDMEAGAWAEKKRKALEDDDAVDDEIDAHEMLQKIRKHHREADKDDTRQLRRVASLYERLMKKYPKTKAAEQARAARAKLPG